jgi:hypothetical protein
MFNLISVIIGIVALIGAMIGFFPLLGWMNWVIVPIALMGAAFGIMSRSDAGRRLNIFVLLVAIVRLVIGGGLF